MHATIEDLPAELFSAIFSFLEPTEVGPVTLALTRATPSAAIPLFHLFNYVRIMRNHQAVNLYQRLTRSGDPDLDGPNSPRTWIHVFSVEGWNVDADIVINLVRILLDLREIRLFVGPKNFAPDHLEELFSKPIQGLSHFGLRFRPYVQKATYYQFLKGAYFDSALQSLSEWPSGSLPSVSIVQDPLDATVAQRQAFAQPLVFFKLDPHLSTLFQSEALNKLHALRLRIPSRQVARSLIEGPLTFSARDKGRTATPSSASVLEYVDLSTCNILENEVDMILASFPIVRYLVLDFCAILKGELREGEWSALGKRCALVGVRRARDKEKRIKTLSEMEYATNTAASMSSSPISNALETDEKRAKRGRRGLATATISLRDDQHNKAGSSVVRSIEVPKNAFPKIRVVPPAPSLRSFCTTISSSSLPNLNDQHVNPSDDEATANHTELKHAFIRAEFIKGWCEGIAQLRGKRRQLRDSWRRSTARVMRFCLDQKEMNNGILDGLEDISVDDEAEFFGNLEGEHDNGVFPNPTICLVGPDTDKDHPPDCGHLVGRGIWNDPYDN